MVRGFKACFSMLKKALPFPSASFHLSLSSDFLTQKQLATGYYQWCFEQVDHVEWQWTNIGKHWNRISPEHLPSLVRHSVHAEPRVFLELHLPSCCPSPCKFFRHKNQWSVNLNRTKIMVHWLCFSKKFIAATPLKISLCACPSLETIQRFYMKNKKHNSIYS